MDHPGGFDLRFFLTTLKNGKWIVFATTLLAMSLAATGNYFQVLRYQAEAQIQIEPPPFLPAPGQDLSSQTNYYTNIDRYFKTQKEKLASRRMRARFAEELKKTDSAYAAQSVDAIAGEFEGGFELEPVEDTNLISLRLISTSPEKAALWLNLYADVFVQDNARLQEENVKQSRELLRAQLNEIKELLGSQQTQMNQVAGTPGNGTAPPSAGDSDLIIRYQTSFEEAKKKRLEEEEKLSRLEAYLSPGADVTAVPNLEPSSIVRSYSERLADAQAALNKLRADGKGEEHPQVSAKKLEIDNLREQIRAELKKTAESLRLSISVLKSSEASAQNNYRESVAQRTANSKQARELNRVGKILDTWTTASSLVEDKLRSLKVLESFVSNNMSVVERAQPKARPVSSRGVGFIFLLGSGGFLFGCALIVTGELLNPKLRGLEEIQDSLGVPSLGFLPKTRNFDLHEIREAYNVLRTEILFRRETQQHRAIMVTSSIPQEGKTTVTMNIGKTLALAGDSTVIVDFDLRKARLRSLLSAGNQSEAPVFSPVEGLKMRMETTATPLLHLLAPASLPDNPPFLLSQPAIRELIQYLRDRYDWVLIDTPPVTSVTDAVILASQVDTVLFVVKHNFVDKRIVRNSLMSLKNVDASIMGAILNDIDVKKMSYYSYQNYYRYSSES
jgi:succinoglycan biosynthesis transport protein ExoP